MIWENCHRKMFSGSGLRNMKRQWKASEMNCQMWKHWNTSIQTEKAKYTLTPVLSVSPQLQKDDDDLKHIIEFVSRALSPVEQRYSQTEREALAVNWACEHLHIFLFGAKFKIYTDHKLLLPLYNNAHSKPPACIQRWTMRVQPYEYELIYRPGHDNHYQTEPLIITNKKRIHGNGEKRTTGCHSQLLIFLKSTTKGIDKLWRTLRFRPRRTRNSTKQPERFKEYHCWIFGIYMKGTKFN